MHRVLLALACCIALAACVTTRPLPAAMPWEQRLAELQQASGWQMGGRAAVAVGTQGWQASLDWRQNGGAAEVHLSGPLGVGAMVLKQTSAGISLNGEPANDAVLLQLQDRLGFDLPLDELKYWLLGIPDPGAPFELTRNAQDRALKLTQAGWTLTFDRYMAVHADVLPALLVMTRDDVRVRIAVEHWDEPR